MEYILNPWPWYISGPLIALVMAVLLYFGKTFAMSSNLATMCSMAGAGRLIDFFKSDWTEKKWNLIVILGALIGGFIAKDYLSVETNTKLNIKKNMMRYHPQNFAKNIELSMIYYVFSCSTKKGVLV